MAPGVLLQALTAVLAWRVADFIALVAKRQADEV
jgi:hypothetical protein